MNRLMQRERHSILIRLINSIGVVLFGAYFVMKTSSRGNFSKMAESCEKLVARMSVGFPAIHWERSIV